MTALETVFVSLLYLVVIILAFRQAAIANRLDRLEKWGTQAAAYISALEERIYQLDGRVL